MQDYIWAEAFSVVFSDLLTEDNWKEAIKLLQHQKTGSSACMGAFLKRIFFPEQRAA